MKLCSFDSCGGTQREAVEATPGEEAVARRKNERVG
jgi:hypothetical protein